ncbi:MAG: DUF2484 family protein [Pseudomonadota bacterium]
MSMPLILVCFWAVVANVIAMMPSRDHHWRNAYILIAVGIPILGFVTAEHGPWVGLLVLAGGCSVLRWPVIYLMRWLRRGGTKIKEPAE